MKRSSESGNTLQFVMIAVLLMVAVNVCVVLGKRAFEHMSEEKAPVQEMAQDEVTQEEPAEIVAPNWW